LDPENPRHYLERAGIYHDMVDYRLALEDYNRAVEIRPEDAGNYAWRGAFFLFWGEYDQAIKDNNRALELDSKSITALLNRSVTFYCMGEYENAIEDCDRIIELTKDKKTFHYYGSMGLKYFCQGKFGQAVGEYSQALKKRPDWAGVYCRRGDAYDKLGKRNKAMTDWTKANQLDHFYPFAADARAAIGAVDLKKQ
jgi:tetratricopeptide (TPR) repeat protein